MTHRLFRLLIVAAMAMVNAVSLQAGYLTTNRTNMKFYSDPECRKVAHSGIQAGNTYYYEDEPVNGVVCFEFGGEKVYAKVEDVFFEGSEPVDGDYDSSIDEAIGIRAETGGEGLRIPGWVWLLVVAGGCFLAYKFYIKDYLKKGNDEFKARQAAEQERRAEFESRIVNKYRFGQDGCPVTEGNASEEFRKKMRTLNIIATSNPGANTTDPHALCAYLLKYQPVMRQFLREVGFEKDFERTFPNSQSGFHNWCWMKLRVDEYIDPERLLTLSAEVYELYKTLSLAKMCGTDEDRKLLAGRAEADLKNIECFDREEKIALLHILCDTAAKDGDAQKNYEYASMLAELGEPYRKEQILKKYRLKSDGVTLDVRGYRDRQIVRYCIIGVVALVVIAVIAAVALYVALIAFVAFCFYTVFKLMINDATGGGGRGSSGRKHGPSTGHSMDTCGGCLKFNTPHCAAYPVSSSNITENSAACGMINKP